MDTNYTNAALSYGRSMYPRPLSGGTVDSGMHAAVTVCTFNTTAVPGMIINGANPKPGAADRPLLGRGAIDFKPTFRPDLTLSATYWQRK